MFNIEEIKTFIHDWWITLRMFFIFTSIPISFIVVWYLMLRYENFFIISSFVLIFVFLYFLILYSLKKQKQKENNNDGNEEGVCL